jgi:hypothetical protein
MSLYSEKWNFQFVAFAYALPQAFFLWGLGVFFANCIFIASCYVELHFAVGLGAVVAFVLLSFLWVVSGFRFRWRFSQLIPKFLRQQKTEGEVFV